jgi:hypothetical protein
MQFAPIGSELTSIQNQISMEKMLRSDNAIKSLCIGSELLAPGPMLEHLRFEIDAALTEKFDASCYEYAVVYDILPPEEGRTNQYTDHILQIAEGGGRPRPFSRRDFFHDTRIDSFLNFHFKTGQSLSPALVTALKVLGPYYEWLLDPEEFDYSRFDPDWLFVHFTKWYKRHFSKCHQLRSFLMQYIIDHPSNNRVMWFYFHTYDRSENDFLDFY